MREALPLRMRKVGFFPALLHPNPARHGDRRGPAPAGPAASLGAPDAPSSDFLIRAAAYYFRKSRLELKMISAAVGWHETCRRHASQYRFHTDALAAALYDASAEKIAPM